MKMSESEERVGKDYGRSKRNHFGSSTPRTVVRQYFLVYIILFPFHGLVNLSVRPKYSKFHDCEKEKKKKKKKIVSQSPINKFLNAPWCRDSSNNLKKI
jgi:hypothetical protein